MQEINERIEEKQELRHADVESRRIELYNKLMNVKSKKKGKKGGKGAKGKGKKKWWESKIYKFQIKVHKIKTS